MFGFLIVLAAISGGLAFGAMMIVGAMLYSGKWTLPGTEQGRVQRAHVAAQVATFQREAAEENFRREQAEVNRQLLSARSIDELAALQDGHFQRQLAEANRG